VNFLGGWEGGDGDGDRGWGLQTKGPHFNTAVKLLECVLNIEISLAVRAEKKTCKTIEGF